MKNLTPITLQYLIFVLVFFATKQNLSADMKNLMTTESLYQGVLVNQTQRTGVIVNEKDKMEAANNSIRFLEGYAAAWSFDDDDFIYKLSEQVAIYLNQHPEKRKAKLPIVMREVLESMDRAPLNK